MPDKNLIAKIQNSFTGQAANFETAKMSFSKQEYLDYTVKAIGLKASDNVLEVAAGTCVCGRAIAPHVKTVICIDATPAMLEVGKTAAKAAGLDNMRFTEGLVEKLPFAAESFDIVITRLSFHHFAEMEKPFAEMCRVLKKDGKLVIIDMEAAAENLRDIENEIEILRDFSHVRNRSRSEFQSLFRAHAVKLEKCEMTPIAVGLTPWMELTSTPAENRSKIISLMEAELAGGAQTGFEPYRKDGEIFFSQRWLFMLGVKE